MGRAFSCRCICTFGREFYFEISQGKDGRFQQCIPMSYEHMANTMDLDEFDS